MHIAGNFVTVMHMTRAFKIESRQYGEAANNFRLFSDLTCSECGRVDSINITVGRNPMPDQAIHKKWQEKGWEVSRRHDADVCPACQAEKKQKNKPEGKIIPMNVVGKALPPNQPSRGDKRAILDLLGEVYQDDGKGYVPGWSDQKVSVDLGVPRKWIEDIRTEFFGDNAANDDVQGFLKEFDILTKDAREAIAEGKKIAADHALIVKALGPLNISLGSINDRLNRLERTANDLRKLLP